MGVRSEVGGDEGAARLLDVLKSRWERNATTYGSHSISEKGRIAAPLNEILVENATQLVTRNRFLLCQHLQYRQAEYIMSRHYNVRHKVKSYRQNKWTNTKRHDTSGVRYK